MGLAPLLQVVIGLIFVYLLMSMLCSGINELLAQKFSRRGNFLKLGLHNVLSDRWMYLRLVNHPLIATLYREQAGKRLRHPSYIPSGNFALALIEVVRLKAKQLGVDVAPDKKGRWSVPDLKKAASACESYGYYVGTALGPLLDGANGNFDRAMANIEGWYDSSMDRVSGWYKRRTQLVLMGVALFATVLLNVDSIEIARALSRSDSLRQAMESAATRAVESKQIAGVALVQGTDDAAPTQENLQALVAQMQALEAQGLPIGFSCLSPAPTKDPAAAPTQSNAAIFGQCWANTVAQLKSGSWMTKLIGWALTVLAVTLGAPFWFDLLNRIVNLRSSGRRPIASTATPPDPADE